MVSLMVTTIIPGAVTIITDTKVRNAKPRDAQYKLSDDRGLCLLVAPNGGKWWRFNYRFDGKQKTLSMGVYPEVGLADARARREAARRLIAAGTDPSDHRKPTKASHGQITENTFEGVAREWFEKFKPRWAPSHSSKVIRRLEVDLFPWIGHRPIAEINAPEVLKCIHRVEGRGAKDTAHRAIQNAGQVFRYAVATGRIASDPTRDLRGAIAPATHKHFAAITEPAAVGELLRAIDGFKGTFVVQCALRLAPLFFVRPGELRRARWEEIDLAKAEWRYFVTKTKKEHIVPLATQAVERLHELHALTGRGTYVFSGARTNGKPMSDAAINAALRRMGYDTKTEITGHGMRAMARTILHQELGIAPEIIEHQLAHRVPDSLGDAYNRTKFLKERRAMMQKWADYLDVLRQGAEVFALVPRVA